MLSSCSVIAPDSQDYEERRRTMRMASNINDINRCYLNSNYQEVDRERPSSPLISDTLIQEISMGADPMIIDVGPNRTSPPNQQYVLLPITREIANQFRSMGIPSRFYSASNPATSSNRPDLLTFAPLPPNEQQRYQTNSDIPRATFTIVNVDMFDKINRTNKTDQSNNKPTDGNVAQRPHKILIRFDHNNLNSNTSGSILSPSAPLNSKITNSDSPVTSVMNISKKQNKK
ncbi:hypothetical protein RDWZM_009068 [Blomia tropicalis]|uniref:Uncharacterized protein n=1 Tax=Blomia tropicalis TaxID=40697 RepID=A0A9Q0RKP9_BLOTA|nr:hypothetical protein RDWZM_009068 [Blomia tropicalis]